MIKIGGLNYKNSDNHEDSYKTLKLLVEKDRDAALSFILGNTLPEEISTRHDLLTCILKNFQINFTCRKALKTLHNTIVMWILNKVSKSEKKPAGFEISEEKVEYPENYTPEMIELKSIKWNTWDGSSMKGYCKIRPLERISQLWEFPITEFDAQWPDIKLPLINIAEDHSPLEKNIIDETLAMEETVKNWEKYYQKLCPELIKIIAKFEN